jgi:serum/glucocorticoid-regulated kinase 2
VFANQTLVLVAMYSLPAGKKVGLRDFNLVKCIGVGGFSRVYLVRKRDTGKFYALKLIDKHFIMEN